jgi:hypothetical protein
VAPDFSPFGEKPLRSAGFTTIQRYDGFRKILIWNFVVVIVKGLTPMEGQQAIRNNHCDTKSQGV